MEKIPAENYLRYFIDRVQEVDGFKKIIKNLKTRVMCIYGPEGIGKSILLSKMMKECEKQGIRWNYTEWSDRSRYGYLDLMRKIRDETSPSKFELFNDQVNFYTKEQYDLKIKLEGDAIQNVNVLQGGEIQKSGVDVHVGHKVEIKDLGSNALRRDQDGSDCEMIIELTRAFMSCLQDAVRESFLVIFLDALEKADEPTKSWIRKEFLEPIRDEKISNMIVVLASREKFELNTSFFECTQEHKLRPFQTDHIQEYLSRYGFEKNKQLAEFICGITKGNPSQIAIHTINYIKYQQDKPQEANV